MLIVSKTAVLLTDPYVKKCFSREFAKILPPFCAQSPSEITNRKLGVLSEMDDFNICLHYHGAAE
ncbi:hypothetical protein M2137_002765 [Parabacteroides sp. PFB2-10]|nr:hypothetical protein [Parabacteroides sp. PFB2-10]